MSLFAAFLFRLFNLFSPEEGKGEDCFKILANSDCVDVEGKALVPEEGKGEDCFKILANSDCVDVEGKALVTVEVGTESDDGVIILEGELPSCEASHSA
ncbi:hypothetical protein QE152_g30107 [Popillia japonica]|uniref:Uncharacterized protein n=1 Tax=Popillia japonica TaxID=7064 RepID=A0AAW1JGL8_POPJA